MNINKFTQNSLQAVQNCEKIAMDYGNQEPCAGTFVICTSYTG